MLFFRILGAFLLLLIVPLGYGRLLTFRYTGMKGAYFYGLAMFYAVFSCIVIPMTIARRPFHEVVYVGAVLCGLSAAVFLADLIWNRKRYSFFSGLTDLKKTLFHYWWFIFPACIILFQIMRSVLRMNGVYSDDDTYLPIILDMIKTDAVIGTDWITGGLNNDSLYSNPKMLLTAWLQSLAAFSSFVGIHPLILIKTILPVFLISWHYLIVWKITSFLNKDRKIRIAVLFFYALLMEFGSQSLKTDLSYYLFTWSWYGKAVLQFIGIPVIILFFLQIRKMQTGWREGLILMIVTMAGVGLSTMSFMLLSIMVTAFVFLECVEKRSVREMWIAVPGFLPIMIGMLLYFKMF